MSRDRSVARLQAYTPLAAVLAYAAGVVVLALVTMQSVAGILDRYREIANLTDLLAQLDGRRASRPGQNTAAAPSGAPFLLGETQAVAGAALLQRVSTAVANAQGTIQSSQVELQRAKSGEGTTSLTASCEIPEPMLQAFLYDIEAGMPFLFVDSLVVHVPHGTGGAETAPMRVLVEVSGQWRRGP